MSHIASMNAATAAEVLDRAAELTLDDLEMVMLELRRRYNEAWREDVAAAGAQARADLAAGRLKAMSVAEIMASLDDEADSSDS